MNFSMDIRQKLAPAVAAATVFFASGAALAAKTPPVPTMQEVQVCYEKAHAEGASPSPDAMAPCLEKELAFVKSEHKDATERVAAMAKAADKEQGVRTRWTKFIQAGQSFDTFVTRECAYFGMTTRGNRRAEKNGELACRINYYRMRTNVLKNRFLSGARR